MRTVDGHRVVVNDGIQYDDQGRWARQVDVFASEQPRGMPAHVELTVYVDAATWAQADQALPSADELAALGLAAGAGAARARPLPAAGRPRGPHHDALGSAV